MLEADPFTAFVWVMGTIIFGLLSYALYGLDQVRRIDRRIKAAEEAAAGAGDRLPPRP